MSRTTVRRHQLVRSKCVIFDQRFGKSRQRKQHTFFTYRILVGPTTSGDEMESDEIDRRLTTTPIDDDSHSSFNEIDRKIMNGEITDDETRSGLIN